MDLAAFLLARIDEDEADARRRVDAVGPHPHNARALAEAEAKRAIVGHYRYAENLLRIVRNKPADAYDVTEKTALVSQIECVLNDLAAVYSDHPDYAGLSATV